MWYQQGLADSAMKKSGHMAMVVCEKVGFLRNQGLQMLSGSFADVVLARFTSLNNGEEGGLLVDSWWC
jgi:hypothetical protein